MSIRIKMLTERKIIDVRPGWLAGSPDRIEVDVCLECGAVVFDVPRHDDWHEANRPTPAPVPESTHPKGQNDE